MKCKQVKELMGPYLYGDLSGDEMMAVRLHARECADCLEDLRSRGAVIGSISDRVPELTDLEKQKITWFVEGAVRASRDRPGFRLRLATVLGGAAVIAAGIVVGVLLASNLARTSAQQAAGPDRKPPAHAKVVVREEPAAAAAKDNSGTARDTIRDKANDTDLMSIMRKALRDGAGIAASRGAGDPKSKREPDEVIQEVPNPAEGPAKDESRNDPSILPKPTESNDARMSPTEDSD